MELSFLWRWRKKRSLPLEHVLNENDPIAASLRERFRRSGTFCLDLVNSPVPGKTAAGLQPRNDWIQSHLYPQELLTTYL